MPTPITNVLLTPSLFGKLILVSLGGTKGLKVTRNMNRDYSKTFGVKGNKQGDTLSVLKPQRFTVSHSLTYDPQGLANIKVPIKVDQISHIGYQWDSSEKTLSLDDAVRRYADPAATALANDINATSAKFIAQNCFNWVGTPASAPTSMLDYLKGEDLMVAQGMGQNETLHCIINRRMSSVYVDANKALFNSQKTIGSQMEQGRVVNTLGYQWDIDETIYTHTVGALGGTPLLNWAAPVYTSDGNNSSQNIILSGCGSVTNYAKAGDKFTIANVYSVHPQTRVSTGYLQQFTVLQDATSSGGALTLNVAPGITPTGQYQNVDSVPVHGAEILFWHGTTATPNAAAALRFKCGLLFHEDSFAFLSVPLENPEPGMGALVKEIQDSDTGIDISIIQSFDGVNRVEINRLDVLWGVGWLNRELACVICGPAN